MSKFAELIDRWNSPEGHPYKGSLIDWTAYEADPTNIGCMCAQGQALHILGGWEPKRIREIAGQLEADAAVAALLNISRSHAVLLRNVNDNVDGAPAIVLTDPGKVLGDQWSKLLDFWWHMDQMVAADWKSADAAGAAAWDAARAAAWEIQGAAIFKATNRPFYFLPMFGFAHPEAIPARPADYGVALVGGGEGGMSYGILDQLADELRIQPHIRGTDPRNIAWADEAAYKLSMLLAGSRLLIAQYQTHDNFTMGGALNNDPFMQITEALEP